MKKKRLLLELQGVKKRIGNIKSILRNLENWFHFEHTSLISTNIGIFFVYNWGHIIIYTYPYHKIITIDIISDLPYAKIKELKEGLLGAFSPTTYKVKE